VELLDSPRTSFILKDNAKLLSDSSMLPVELEGDLGTVKEA
jgi:hypothetical protein